MLRSGEPRPPPTVVTSAHLTMDTEKAAADALAKIFDLRQATVGDPAKVTALAAELEARRLPLAQ